MTILTPKSVYGILKCYVLKSVESQEKVCVKIVSRESVVISTLNLVHTCFLDQCDSLIWHASFALWINPCSKYNKICLHMQTLTAE